jgi:Ser/Thr protein kinase RdoA (MazF antagonist)
MTSVAPGRLHALIIHAIGRVVIDFRAKMPHDFSLPLATDVNDHSFDELFARYATRFRPIAPLESLGGAGGLSGAKLWRFGARHGELLLRAWPPHGPGRAHIERVHRWLRSTSELGFVPVPIRDRAGDSLQEWRGTLWEVVPWLAGAADLSRPPSVVHIRLAFTGLAAFHQRLAGEQIEAVSPGLRHRHDEITRLVGGGFRALEIAINRHDVAGSPHRPAALAWLGLARNVAPVLLEPLGQESTYVIRVQPILRDARPEHFLFENDRLCGLVDFGAMGVESVAADLARLIGEWFDDDPAERTEAIATYEQVRPLGPGEARLIDVFATATALLIGERWARWHYVENRGFDDPQAVSKGLDRGLTRLDRLAHELGASRPTF